MASNTATKIHARSTAAQTISEDTVTKIALGTVVVDSKTEFDNVNDKFTATKTGRYMFELTGNRIPTSVNYGYYIVVYKNGSLLVTEPAIKYTTSDPNAISDIDCSVILDLTAADYIQFYYYAAAGAGDTDVYLMLRISEISELVFEL